MAVLDQLRHLAIEERHQQRGDVRAVDIGVGHDDDALVAQLVVVVVSAGAAAQRLDQVLHFLVLAQLARRVALATFRILPRSGRIACVSRLRACLAEPPAESPSTRKISVPSGLVLRAVGQLAGQAQLARRGLALLLAVLLAPQPVLGLGDHMVEQHVAALPCRRSASARNCRRRSVSTSLVASTLTSFSLVWPWNCGCSMKIDTRPAAPSITSSAVIDRCPCGCRSARHSA